MFKSREIYHKYCLTILLNHDTSGHLARIHSSTFLSHYNILCCHTTFKNKWDPVTLPFSPGGCDEDPRGAHRREPCGEEEESAERCVLKGRPYQGKQEEPGSC